MHGIILAAGRGSRLGELTSNNPKCLTIFHKKSLLHYIIGSLIEGGCSSITIVGGYKSDVIGDFLSEFYPQVKLVINNRWNETNMVDSLLVAEQLLNSEPCIVSYGDIFYSKNIINEMIRGQGEFSIAFDINGKKLWEDRFKEPLTDIENFKLNSDGSLKIIGGKVITLDDVEGQYMGLLKFTPASFEKFKAVLSRVHSEERNCISMTSTIALMLNDGVKVDCIPNREFWGELDSPEDILFFEQRGMPSSVQSLVEY